MCLHCVLEIYTKSPPTLWPQSNPFRLQHSLSFFILWPFWHQSIHDHCSRGLSITLLTFCHFYKVLPWTPSSCLRSMSNSSISSHALCHPCSSPQLPDIKNPTHTLHPLRPILNPRPFLLGSHIPTFLSSPVLSCAYFSPCPCCYLT